MTTSMAGHIPSQGWSPQPEVGHQPEGSVVQTWNLALKFNSQNENQMKTSMDGHLPSLGWSPTNQRMVTHLKEVYCRLGIWHLYLTHKTKTRWQLPWMVPNKPKDGHPPKEKLQTWNLTLRPNQKISKISNNIMSSSFANISFFESINWLYIEDSRS